MNGKGDGAVSFKFGPILSVSAGLLWFGLLAAGLSIVWHYENTPGLAAQAPSSWPVASRIPRSLDGPTLVLLAHPHCPCTRASLGELDRLLAQCQGAVKTFVLFYQPHGLPKDRPNEWTKTDLWQTAAAIPGVTVLPDAAGREAQLFRATTSGQVVLYDASGQLLFDGGITGARGHAGDNAGSLALRQLVTHEVAEYNRTQVFGCALFEASGTSQTEGVQQCNP